ncbi:hypothetical protein FJZ31_37630 [Candidatus Poribacteria bacterium]|nr:hypothetical protein [Candidatus Poribacteria bacterium]
MNFKIAVVINLTIALYAGFLNSVYAASALETNPDKALAGRLLITPMPKDEILKNLGVAGLITYSDKDDKGDNKLRYGGLVNFAYQIAKLSAEFGMSQDGKDEINGRGFAVATEVKLGTEGPLNNLAIIGRLDSWDANTDKDEDETMRIIGG